MSGYDFGPVLDYLCAGIPSPKRRQQVRDELYDHLMCEYETGLAVGKSEEKAGEDAVNALGDRDRMRSTLSELHSVFPKISMKKAINLLIAGIVLRTFHINFFAGMEDIVNQIAAVLMLTGVFCLSKSGARMKKAFALFCGYTLLCFGTDAFLPLYEESRAAVTVAGCAVQALYLLSYFALLGGLEELCAPYLTDTGKKLRFFECRGMTLAGSVTAVLYKLAVANTNGEYAAVIPIIIGIAAKIMTLILLVRVNRLLYKADHEYKIEDDTAKKAVFAVLALTCAAVLVFGAGAYYAMQPVNSAPYMINDTDMTPGEREKIHNVLKTYNFDPDLLAVLPCSETENYRHTAPYDFDGEDAVCCVSVSGAYREFCYAVPISERDDEYRILRYVTYEEPVKNLRACFVPDNRGLPINDGKTTVLVLEKDPQTGEISLIQPYRVAYDGNGGVTRVEYRATGTTSLLIAQNFCIWKMEDAERRDAADMGINLRIPFAGLRRSLKDIAGNGESFYQDGLLYDRTSIPVSLNR